MEDITKIISVAVIEDDNEIRNLMHALIDNSPGFSCKQLFADCESAIKHIREFPPDVVLMDVELPGINGVEGVKQLKPGLDNTEFIMLTIRDDDDTVFQALVAGATGYLLKDTPPSILLDSIQQVYSGGSPMTASIARKVVQHFKPVTDSPLSTRELEILNLLCQGKNYGKIGEELFISGHTVRNHIKNIYNKMQVHTRAEAVNKAIRDRLV